MYLDTRLRSSSCTILKYQNNKEPLAITANDALSCVLGHLLMIQDEHLACNAERYATLLQYSVTPATRFTHYTLLPGIW